MPKKPKGGRRNYDWLQIKTDYVTNADMSLRKIERKYGIPHRTIQLKSKADNWFATKQEYQQEVSTKAIKKLSTKKANELAGLVEASDYIEKTILKAFNDPDYFNKHIVTQNLNEEQATLDILNTKAMKDMMRVIKDVEDVKRSILDIRKADVTERMRIEQERLELEKERLALEKERIALKNSMSGSDGENNYGVVIMPEVIADEQ